MSSEAVWWQRSWNPLVGCTPVSEGCAHCYAARLASTRLAHMPHYDGLTNGQSYGGLIREAPALRRGPPKMKDGILFCCNMGDLFHDGASEAQIAKVLLALDRTPSGVRPVVLTKRPERMAESMMRHARSLRHLDLPRTRIGCGVTVETQARADERLHLLTSSPCAWTFASVEPLLEAIDLSWGLNEDLGGLSWVVVGGESGENARVCRREWIGHVVFQCIEAGVPVWVKQLGSAYRDDSTGTYGNGCALVNVLAPSVQRLQSPAGGKMDEWPEVLRVREKP